MGQTTRRNSICWLAVAGVLCVGLQSAAHALTPIPEHPPIPQFTTELSAGHPLVGQVFKVETGEALDPALLTFVLPGPGFVLIGEKHDNPDHHALQAWMYQVVLGGDHKSGLAYEMIGENQQSAINAYLAGKPADMSGLGPALDWEKSGWPDWKMYQPMADSAAAAGLPIIAANVPRDIVRNLHGQGPDVLGEDRVNRIGLNTDLPAEISDGLLDDVFEGHCKLMPREHLAGMVNVQRARDAVMAENLIKASADSSGSVLIAGNGHVREDRGVPLTLRQLAPGARITTIALLEVQEDALALMDYAPAYGGTLPFDYVWFTPRANDRDYCAELKEKMGGHSTSE